MNLDASSRSSHQSAAFLFLIAGIILFGIMLSPAPAKAGLLLDAELRFTYEDNVVGLLSDQQRGGTATSPGTGGGMIMTAGGMGGMGGGKSRYTGTGSGSTGSPGDFSATLYAEAGGYRDVFRSSAVYAKGFAQHTAYGTYTDLDATIGGVNAGITTKVTDMLSTRIALIGKIKRFGDSQRNSDAYGGNLSLKQNITPSFWLRVSGEYERNSADNALFSYDGTSGGIAAGYATSGKGLLTAGYLYLVRKFDEPSGAEMKTNTAFFGGELGMGKHWSAGAEYDLQASKDSVTGTSTTDNIFSVALRYSY